MKLFIAQDVHEWFDTSNYPNDHLSGIDSEVNKKVIGKFKDEAGGLIISEFIWLRSKLYSFRTFEGEEKKVCIHHHHHHHHDHDHLLMVTLHHPFLIIFR